MPYPFPRRIRALCALSLAFSLTVCSTAAAALPPELPPTAAQALSLLGGPYAIGGTAYTVQSLLQRHLSGSQVEETPAPEPEPDYPCVKFDPSLVPYVDVSPVQDPSSPYVLVNKHHYLRDTFVPELVTMEKGYASYSARMEPTAYQWFVKMVDAARADGLTLYCVSAYRSYTYQDSLYQNFVRKYGQASADTYSARAGYSEHQTGLAADINASSRKDNFENSKEYRWLVENSWKYGFILRYPEGKQSVTGFRFEPWHYRYVGQDLAKKVYESGLTYEEFLGSLSHT